MSDETMLTIVSRIKSKRIENGLSFQDLANATGMAKSTLQRYESGSIKNIPLDKLKILAKGLNTTAEYIMGWEKKKSSERLQEIMEARNLTQTDILEMTKPFCEKYRIKLGKSALSQYVSGKFEPGQWKLTILGLALNVSEAWLMGYDVPITRDETTLTPIETYPTNIYKVELKKFPLLENVACGEPIWAEEDRTSYIMANSDIKADFCLVAKGDSMINARILDGDIVFIKEMPIVKDGEIGAIIIDNETTLKRVYYNKEDNMLTLVPENPTCRTFRYQNEELDNIRILGKAVYFTSKMR